MFHVHRIPQKGEIFRTPICDEISDRYDVQILEKNEYSEKLSTQNFLAIPIGLNVSFLQTFRIQFPGVGKITFTCIKMEV